METQHREIVGGGRVRASDDNLAVRLRNDPCRKIVVVLDVDKYAPGLSKSRVQIALRRPGRCSRHPGSKWLR